MAAIRSKGTKPEMIVRKYLWAHGFRYRLNSPRLPGHPDIVLRKYRTCVFVNGCFWHGHEGCQHFRMPKTNTGFWAEKIARNKERDKVEQRLLARMGWHCITVWECELKPKERSGRSSRWLSRSTIFTCKTVPFVTPNQRKISAAVWLPNPIRRDDPRGQRSVGSCG